MKATLTTSVLSFFAASSVFAQDIVQSGDTWFVAGQARIQAELAKQPNTNRAKNIIIFIADGNGVGTNYATRLFHGQQNGNFGDENVLPQEVFPHLALVKTYNTNAQTPDSAGTATAIMTGVKTKAGVVNVTEDANRGECASIVGNELTTIAEIMSGPDKSVGLISTARVTHATPSEVYSKPVDRNFEDGLPDGCTEQKDIATQLVDAMEAGLVDLAMGGGRRHFLPDSVTDEEGKKGRREDVAVYAKGPFAHLFDGTIEQSVIFHVMHHAATAE